ncbi:MAG: cupin domain-containing protein [Meiothermus sp.]|uniref:cupin domain-containing protein n=1 Tax=Meiothermus sp. TaxID=1955249 RepID=UPI0025D0E684|nr:cupin domain-containing protein [Meiothermus sp.]MCS7057262.1 cupin domain-containing protein [Meiothermus sp.]MCS7193630.1 cupin domain-containing protein [Meiothermus sp.]MCX7740412.1 cupin domain-containing protein [Meiothermus sp.]MDW8091429.1 cupin domain-containing protein [Meiothermus sp.]MDW8481897.1 cupin domain-containing protein [Meiothermus sp.]
MRARAKTKRAAQGYTWEDVEVLAYKAEGTAAFRGVTRQVLFRDPQLAAEWRYFEVEPGGHTTLERHQHVHAVMVIRGRGACLVGEEVHPIGLFDLITVPPFTWHQFRAAEDEPLGFLCLVNAQRDRPKLPSPEELDELRKNPQVADFIRV